MLPDELTSFPDAGAHSPWPPRVKRRPHSPSPARHNSRLSPPTSLKHLYATPRPHFPISGTGKTTAVVELIRQEVARGSRVLACAASNIAVDNLVERLASSSGGKASSSSSSSTPGLRVVRLGHPARLLPQVLENSLEAHVLRSDNSSLAKDCRK
jgi:hypothetical protein